MPRDKSIKLVKLEKFTCPLCSKNTVMLGRERIIFKSKPRYEYFIKCSDSNCDAKSWFAAEIDLAQMAAQFNVKF